MKRRIGDRLTEGTVWLAGAATMLIIVAIFFYLAHESGYAFDRKFSYGFRFAVQPPQGASDDLGQDPNSSLLTANPEGMDGVDDKEDGILMPTLDQLKGTAQFGSGTALTGDLAKVDPSALYRDDWRGMKPANKGDRFLLFAFATPECASKTMVLAWQPDECYDPNLTPYDVTLRLLRGPAGTKPQAIVIDLKRQPKGRIELPAFIAKTDADRTNGYVFAMTAKPQTNNFFATLNGIFRTDWAPTMAYPRFGFAPLILGTLAITLVAVVIAVPLAIAAAVYLSEIARPRLREWLKPAIELLASVPTVVLGYFGLMLVAPALKNTLGDALGMTSGRALLTAALMMAVLILPVIITVAEDALWAAPGTLRDGAEALGLTTAEGIRKVLLPAARAGVTAAVLLGTARAVGETMIVWILSGGSANMPQFGSVGAALGNLVRPVRGVPDSIAIEMGNCEFEGVHYGHLFLLGLVLFCLTLAFNLIGYYYGRRRSWQS